MALVKLLDIEVTRYSPKTDLGQFQGAVFVDNQGTTTSLTRPILEVRIPVLIVVDHHERQEALGQDSTGEYLGGGCRDAGGFQVPIGFLLGAGAEDLGELKWEVFDRQIRSKFFRKLDIAPRSGQAAGSGQQEQDEQEKMEDFYSDY